MRTATQAAWEIAKGDIPPGARIISCPTNKLCVRIKHLDIDARTQLTATPIARRSELIAVAARSSELAPASGS